MSLGRYGKPRTTVSAKPHVEYTETRDGKYNAGHLLIDGVDISGCVMEFTYRRDASGARFLTITVVPDTVRIETDATLIVEELSMHEDTSAVA